jgi:hypothetical protein
LVAGLGPVVLPWGVLLGQLNDFADTRIYAPERGVLELFSGQMFVSSRSAHHKSNFQGRQAKVEGATFGYNPVREATKLERSVAP